MAYQRSIAFTGVSFPEQPTFLDTPPIRVLIVDNEPVVVTTLAASLEKMREKYIVDTAHNFNQAFSQVQRTSYTLLIADYKMPGLNGLDLARAVQLVSPDTQISLMTAYGTHKLRDTVEQLGLSGYLEKPFTLSQFREFVRHSVNKIRSVRRVLLLGKKDDLRRLYRDALWSAGYKVCEATSLQAAHDLLAHYRFDALICTLEASGIGSVNFIRQQAAHLGQSGTHIIAISNQGSFRPICEEIGVEFYLETPIATGPLVTLLNRLTL